MLHSCESLWPGYVGYVWYNPEYYENRAPICSENVQFIWFSYNNDPNLGEECVGGVCKSVEDSFEIII